MSGATSDNATQKSITARSSRISANSGIADAASCCTAVRAAIASAKPRPPPTTEMISDSVSSCRTRRRRPAPSARRIASSRTRAVARPSWRLAMFAQTIRNSRPTAPLSISSAGRGE